MMLSTFQMPTRRQRIDSHRGPAGSYENLQKPLTPPKGMVWIQDTETKDWHLEKIPKDCVVTAVRVDGNSSNKEAQTQRYIEHHVQPKDTFHDICLQYKVTPAELLSYNNFSGSDTLLFATKTLRIPISTALAHAEIVDDHKYLTEKMMQSLPGLSISEARAYLELNDWWLEDAMHNAREDQSS